MRRVAVIGPNPPCGVLSSERFAELLSQQVGLEAFSLRPMEGLVAATAPVTVELPGYPSPILVDADTLVWLRFSARAYLRDWIAGWLDQLLNGAAGARRRNQRASLLDVLRACAAGLQPAPADAKRLERLRPHLQFVELFSAEQALFWLRIQTERVRETQPPRE